MDDEKFKNLVLFNFYGTDAEMEEAAPWMLIVVVVIIALFVISGR